MKKPGPRIASPQIATPGVAALTVAILGACASLGLEGVVQRPRFQEAEDRTSRLRAVPPGAERPAGGAEVRLWTRIENPNGFGLRITRLAGDLLLEEAEGIEFDLPLGLPLTAGQDTVIPIDLSVGFEDVPELLSAVTGAAVSRRAVRVTLRGTIGVDAGRLGEVVFGPLSFLEAEVPVAR